MPLRLPLLLVSLWTIHLSPGLVRTLGGSEAEGLGTLMEAGGSDCQNLIVVDSARILHLLATAQALASDLCTPRLAPLTLFPAVITYLAAAGRKERGSAARPKAPSREWKLVEVFPGSHGHWLVRVMHVSERTCVGAGSIYPPCRQTLGANTRRKKSKSLTAAQLILSFLLGHLGSNRCSNAAVTVRGWSP